MDASLGVDLETYRRIADARTNQQTEAETEWELEGSLLLRLPGRLFSAGADCLLTVFEPWTFNAYGVKYTPDFLHLFQLNEGGPAIPVLVEVKGYRQPSHQYSMTRMKLAAHLHPWFIFLLAEKDKTGEWKIRRIENA